MLIYYYCALSKLALIEHVHLHEGVVEGSEDGLEVVDELGGQLAVGVGVLVPAGLLHEDVDELLLGPDGVVGPLGAHPPLEGVLLGMVLGQEEGVFLGLQRGQELRPVSGLAGRDQVPERGPGGVGGEGVQHDRPAVVEVEDARPGHRLAQFLLAQGLQEPAVRVFDQQGAGETVLASYMCEDGGVVGAATGDVHDSLVPQAGGPDGVGVAQLVLLLGVIEDESRVVGPLVAPMDGHLAAGEEHPVDLAQDTLELRLAVVIVEGDNLRTCHLQVLDVGCGNVCRVVTNFDLAAQSEELLGVLGVDANDWLLGHLAQGDSEAECDAEQSGYWVGHNIITGGVKNHISILCPPALVLYTQTLQMQYINVSQFYQSILCFSLPLLLIQRIILFCYDLSHQYEDYRQSFYEEQFKFTCEYEYQQHAEAVGDGTVKDGMLDKRENNDKNEKLDEGIFMERPEDSEIRSRIDSQVTRNNNNDEPVLIVQSKQTQKPVKISIDLETDRQLINSKSVPVLQATSKQQIPVPVVATKQQKQQVKSQSQPENTSPQRNQQPEKQQVSSPERQSIKIQQQNRNSAQLREQARMSKVTVSDIEVRRETQLDRGSFEQGVKTNNESKQTQKQIIELGTGQLLEKGEKDRVRLKFCRRIDDAFNDYVPIILSVVVLGIVSRSVYIYSMCCFFGYAFTSLLFNYANLLDKLEGAPDTNSCFSKSNQLISSLFIFGLFISYWVSNEFS